MIIYTNGCSHSIGIGSNYAWSEIVSKALSRNMNYLTDIYLENYKIFEKNTFYNFADSGKGNDLIFIETIDFITKCKKNKIKPDYIFIQWSGPSRFTSQEFDGKLRKYTPSDDSIELFSFEPFASIRTLTFIYTLQELFKKENIEYYFCCYMDLDKSIIDTELYSSIDLSKFISFDSQTNPITDGFRQKMIEYGYILDANGHPSFYGHYYIANKFLDVIKIPNTDIGFFEILPDKNKLPFGIYLADKIDYIGYYMDNMINKKNAMKYSKEGILKEGGREEKNKLRKSIF